MKKITTVALLLLWPALLLARPFRLDRGNIKFEAPANFKPLSKKIIRLKFPGANAPTFAVGTKTASSSIAYDLKKVALLPQQLPEAQKAITKAFTNSIHGIEWKKNEIVYLPGESKRKWIRYEFISSASDTEVYNIILITSYKEKMLLFNFNSIMSDYQKYEQALNDSIESIQIK